MMNLSPIQAALSERLQPLVRQEDGSCLTSICFDHNFCGYEGHFPQKPIVPAVCLMAAALMMTSQWLNTPLTLHEIVHMKFRRQIGPDDTVLFSFMTETGGEAGRLSVAYALTLPSGNKVASFKLLLTMKP